MNQEVDCLEGGEVSHAGVETFQIVGIVAASLPGNLSWVPPTSKQKPEQTSKQKPVKTTL